MESGKKSDGRMRKSGFEPAGSPDFVDTDDREVVFSLERGRVTVQSGRARAFCCSAEQESSALRRTGGRMRKITRKRKIGVWDYRFLFRAALNQSPVRDWGGRGGGGWPGR